MATDLFQTEDRKLAESFASLCYVNPFSPKRAQVEKQILGEHFKAEPDAWALGPGHLNPNLVLLKGKVGLLLERARKNVSEQTTRSDQQLYVDVARLWLYSEFRPVFRRLYHELKQGDFSQHNVPEYELFLSEVSRLVPAPIRAKMITKPEHLFACLFQIYRAFQNIRRSIIGASLPAQALRAAVFNSVLTCDITRYERSVYKHLHEVNTLILGPSGTGKELVARGIGLSGYLPFDPEERSFKSEVSGAFFPLNVSALAPTLVESELFGHQRGSFTGAIGDRVGWLESCPKYGTVFLDEIGDLDLSIQVKLLRTLQSREFQRVGDSQVRRFQGKLVTATNRDLNASINDGTFREDFYYRLCSDVVRTPSLREQLTDRPEDLELLVRHTVAQNFDEAEVESISQSVMVFIDRELGSDYAWPGNVRELSQCIFSVVIRGSYEPRRLHLKAQPSVLDSLTQDFVASRVDAERLLDVYCTLAYAQIGSFSQTGRQLGLDRRTIKSRIDDDLLGRLLASDHQTTGPAASDEFSKRE